MNFGAKTRFRASALALILSACNLGGLNDNINGPGDEPGGVQLSLGKIAVSTDGEVFLFEQGDDLAVGVVKTGEVHTLPVKFPSRLAFSKERSVVYVTTELGQVSAVDYQTREALWTMEADVEALVAADKNDRNVVIAGTTRSQVRSAEDGALKSEVAQGSAAVDIDLLDEGDRALVILRETWLEDGTPEAEVQVLGLETGEHRSFSVPNCADNVIVSPSQSVALLSPTICTRDPISHLDLTPGKERYVENLPGFGPVAMSPSGQIAVGFLDMNAIDESLFHDPSEIPSAEQRFHLMLIDTDTMRYEFVPFGQNRPRYAPTPSGALLLIDEVENLSVGSNAQIFDVESKTFRSVEGLSSYEELSFASDEGAYVLSDRKTVAEASTETGAGAETDFSYDFSLFHLDIEAAKARAMPTPFRPRNLNISPDASLLFLRIDAESICLYDVASESCERTLNLAPVVSES